MPENTLYVGRPTKWGNPFKKGCEVDSYMILGFDRSDKLYYGEGVNILSNAEAVSLFEKYCLTEKFKGDIRNELKGKNIACFCRIGSPCHGEKILEIANQ